MNRGREVLIRSLAYSFTYKQTIKRKRTVIPAINYKMEGTHLHGLIPKERAFSAEGERGITESDVRSSSLLSLERTTYPATIIENENITNTVCIK